jgi:hypothetical protein
LVIEDPDTGQLHLPVAVVDEFAVEASPDPGRFEVVVRIEVRGDAEPLDAVMVADHVQAVLRAWQAGPPQDPLDTSDPFPPSDVDAPAVPTLRGPALVADSPDWIMLGPMTDTRLLACGQLFANAVG